MTWKNIISKRLYFIKHHNLSRRQNPYLTKHVKRVLLNKEEGGDLLIVFLPQVGADAAGGDSVGFGVPVIVVDKI